MVIGDLFTVADLSREDLRDLFLAEQDCGDGGNGRHGVRHVVGQKAAVGAGIGTELFFVKALRIVQRLLGGVA